MTQSDKPDGRLRALARAYAALDVPAHTPGEADPRSADRPSALAINLAQADVLLTRISGLSAAVGKAEESDRWDAIDTFLAKSLVADLAFLAANFRWMSFAVADDLRLAREALDDATAALEAAGGLPPADATATP